MGKRCMHTTSIQLTLVCLQTHHKIKYMLYMGVVTCPYAHAKILSIDTSKAEAAGYLTLTAEDLPPWQFWSTTGRQYTPLPLAGRDEVLYTGKPVACVAAPTTDLVEDAIALVNVTVRGSPICLGPGRVSA